MIRRGELFEGVFGETFLRFVWIMWSKRGRRERGGMMRCWILDMR